MTQRTFIIIKPDAYKRKLTGEVFKRFEEGGLTIKALKGPFIADKEVVRKHYQIDNYDYVLTLGHVDVSRMSEEGKKAAYDKNLKIVGNLQEFLLSGSIIIGILEGEDGVKRVREILGKTNPAASPKGTIRGDLGDDSYEAADKENRAVRTLVHGSGSPEEAEFEINLWFGESRGPGS